jgi:hypothetical protein
MANLLIVSVLLGVVLGRFFKVLILVPACAFILAAVLVGSAAGEHGLLRPLLEFAILNAALQIGYASSLLSIFIRTPKKTRPRAFSATPIVVRASLGMQVRVHVRDAGGPLAPV